MKFLDFLVWKNGVVRVWETEGFGRYSVGVFKVSGVCGTKKWGGFVELVCCFRWKVRHECHGGGLAIKAVQDGKQEDGLLKAG